MTTHTNGSRGFIMGALLVGFIAGFVWMAITELTGEFSTGAIVGGGFAMLVGVAAVTAMITTLMGARARG